MTALTAARQGVDSILLVEKHREWGLPVQCAEAVPKLISLITRIPHEAVAHRIGHIGLYLDGEPMGQLRTSGFVIHREIFEADLARRAAEHGVECLRSTRVTHVGERDVTLLVGETWVRVEAEVIVGADGPRSIVRDSMGLPSPMLMRALQHTLPLRRAIEGVETYFSPRYGAGYAWCFPKGDVANVGLALDPGEGAKQLRRLFDDLVVSLRVAGKVAEGPAVRRCGGLIPVSGPVSEFVSGNKLLVGDAAGLTDPLLGAGIHAAVASGRFAGRAIAGALKKDDLSCLREHDEECWDLFGTFLGQNLARRTRLAQCSAEEYPETVRSAWRLTKARSRLRPASLLLRRLRRHL
jgi:geranylgeranyl reductase family protein